MSDVQTTEAFLGTKISDGFLENHYCQTIALMPFIILKHEGHQVLKLTTVRKEKKMKSSRENGNCHRKFVICVAKIYLLLLRFGYFE